MLQESEDADTLSGLLAEKAGVRLQIGQQLNLENAIMAEVVTMIDRKAANVRLTITHEDLAL